MSNMGLQETHDGRRILLGSGFSAPCQKRVVVAHPSGRSTWKSNCRKQRVGGLDEGRLLVCKLDLVSERLLEHVKVLDVGSLSCTTALTRNLGLLQQATALVPLRSWVWGTLGIIVVGGLDESHLLVCKLDLVSERLLEHVKVLDVVSLSCTNGLELSHSWHQ